MSTNSLSNSSTVLTIYLRTHISTLNSLLLHFATLINTYLTKSLPHINPNLIILGNTFYIQCILYYFTIHFIFIMMEIFAYYASIMCSMLLPPYYAGIIGSCLFSRSFVKTIQEFSNDTSFIAKYDRSIRVIMIQPTSSI